MSLFEEIASIMSGVTGDITYGTSKYARFAEVQKENMAALVKLKRNNKQIESSVEQIFAGNVSINELKNMTLPLLPDTPFMDELQNKQLDIINKLEDELNTTDVKLIQTGEKFNSTQNSIKIKLQKEGARFAAFCDRNKGIK